MKQTVTKKPLSNSEYEIVRGKDPLIDLILNTGARRNEVVTLIKSWTGDDYMDIQTKKSGDDTNRIYLNKQALECLKQLQERYKKIMSTLTTKTIYNHVVSTLQVLLPSKRDEASPHTLRATFATMLLQNGVDLVRVQTLMNHSDLSTTARYIQFDESSLRQALDSFNNDDVWKMSIDQMKSEILQLRSKLAKYEK